MDVFNSAAEIQLRDAISPVFRNDVFPLKFNSSKAPNLSKLSAQVSMRGRRHQGFDDHAPASDIKIKGTLFFEKA